MGGSLIMDHIPYVKTGAVKKIFNTLDELRKFGYVKDGDTNLVVFGETGVGKTTLIERYMSVSPPVEEEEFTRIPVLHVVCSSESTKRQLIETILIAIGDPQKSKGASNTGELQERLVNFCSNCCVEIVIFDEVHSIIQGRSPRVIHTIGDWFKEIINKIECPVAFFGMPWTLELIESNAQLSSRFGYRHHIETFKVSSGFNLYCKFISHFCRGLNLEDGFDLGSPENAYRIFAFSSGHLRPTAGLLISASRRAGRENSLVNLDMMVRVVASKGYSAEENVFLVPINDLVLREVCESSKWKHQPSKKKKEHQEAVYRTFKLNKKLNLFETTHLKSE